MHLAGAALAGPGAHGPNGEHLQTGGVASSTSLAQPRFEATSELFELVAVLGGGELSILIDRFDSNAPVLGARVEVEVAGRKAEAKFHADHGDYAIDDAALIAALSRPGEYGVVVSVVAGENSDLLNGTLVVAGPVAPGAAGGRGEHDHDHVVERWAWIGSGIAVLAAAMFIGWRRRQRRALATAA
jgi:hypothetical protein